MAALTWSRLALLCVTPLVSASGASADADLWLGDDSFRAHVVADAEGLREKYGPRFDPVRVERVQRDGLEFLGEEGLIDEFNSRWSPPPGYEKGFEGGFLKIGVGLLQRTRITPYRFWDPYPVVQPAITRLVEHSDLRAVFEQRFEAGRWGYVYRKAITVDPARGQVEISYEFLNTGREGLAFDQYNHNWLLMESGRPWALETSLNPGIQWLVAARPTRSGMRFERAPEAPAYFTAPQHGRSTGGWARCSDGLRQVTLMGQMPVSRLSIFVKDGFLAPEIFGFFQVQPGETVSWKRIYIFRREGGPVWK